MDRAIGADLSFIIGTCLLLIQVLGLYIITGLSGQVSLGHAAFALCGTYAAAVLNTRYGWSPWLTIPAAGLAGSAFGFLLGIPSLRVRDDFLAIVTLGFGLVVPALIRRSGFLGASLGISNVQPLTVGPNYLTERAALVLVIVVVLIVLVWLIERSWQGMIWRSIIDDELAAESSGVNVRRSRLLAFSLGATISGLGGALSAHHVLLADSESYKFYDSIIFLAIVVIGSTTKLLGVLGAAIGLSFLFNELQEWASYRMTIYGLLLVVLMHYRQRRQPKPKPTASA